MPPPDLDDLVEFYSKRMELLRRVAGFDAEEFANDAGRIFPWTFYGAPEEDRAALKEWEKKYFGDDDPELLEESKRFHTEQLGIDMMNQDERMSVTHWMKNVVDAFGSKEEQPYTNYTFKDHRMALQHAYGLHRAKYIELPVTIKDTDIKLGQYIIGSKGYQNLLDVLENAEEQDSSELKIFEHIYGELLNMVNGEYDYSDHSEVIEEERKILFKQIDYIESGVEEGAIILDSHEEVNKYHDLIDMRENSGRRIPNQYDRYKEEVFEPRYQQDDSRANIPSSEENDMLNTPSYSPPPKFS